MHLYGHLRDPTDFQLPGLQVPPSLWLPARSARSGISESISEIADGCFWATKSNSIICIILWPQGNSWDRCGLLGENSSEDEELGKRHVPDMSCATPLECNASQLPKTLSKSGWRKLLIMQSTPIHPLLSHYLTKKIIEGSLEVKLPTMWTDEKQRREEKRRVEDRRSEKRKNQKKEDPGARKR